MKKHIKLLVFTLILAILILPSAAFASQGNGNSQWDRFDLSFIGYNGEGAVSITDNSPVFDYVLADSSKDGRLVNGDTVTLNVVNPGGDIVKTMDYTVEGLAAVTNSAFTFMSNSSSADYDSWVFRFRNGNGSDVNVKAQIYNGGPIIFDETVPANQTIFIDVPKADFSIKPTIVLKYYDAAGNLLGSFTK